MTHPEVDQPVRLSKNARLVLAVVAAQVPGEHAAANDIYVAVRRRQPSVGVSTVYRALDRLSAAGLIHAVRVPGAASAVYEPARSDHAHFRCTACGRLEDIHYELPERDLAAIDTRHGFAITGVEMTFVGLCAACRGGLEGKPFPAI